MMNELKDIKKDDEVYLTGYSYSDIASIIKVTKVTDTMIICDKKKFRKSTGDLIGNTDRWHFPRIQLLTDELRKKIRHIHLSLTISRFQFNTLSLEELEKIYEIIKPRTQADKKSVS